MPPIYYLNPPPNPFWDFVAGLEDHPMFTGPAGPPRWRRGSPPPPPPPQPAATPNVPGHEARPQEEMSEKAKGKQPTVEDPPEVDPSTIKPDNEKADEQSARGFPFRGRGRFGHAFEGEEGPGRRGRHGCRGGRGRGGWHGPPPFMAGHPFFAHPPWAQPRSHGPPGPPPHGHGPHGPHAHHGPHGHRGPSPPPHPPRPGFDLGEFLNNLGNKLGVDLSNAAEGLGLTADRFTAGRTGADVNFEPRADIFENKNQYIIHLSLPGAKKSDIGVDYDGEHSILRATGVVHRPDVDEKMLSELVVDGRKRETGVFEKAIRLGTKRDPANIDVAAITAKMTDGVLVVKIPKVEKIHHKREVPVTADPIEEGQADYEDEYSEKPVLFDAEEQASVAPSDTTETQKREPISLIDMRESEVRQKPVEERESAEHSAEPASKHAEAKEEKEKAKATEEEQLPAYTADATHDHEEDDWEKFSDASGEGEYIKINVD